MMGEPSLPSTEPCPGFRRTPPARRILSRQARLGSLLHSGARPFRSWPPVFRASKPRLPDELRPIFPPGLQPRSGDRGVR